MSQSTRIFGNMIATCSIGGVSYLLVCENTEVKFENNTQKAEALKDAWEYPIGIRGKWSASGSFFISTDTVSGEGGPGGTLWTKALANLSVPVIVKDNAISGAGNTLSGNALITTATQSIGDNAQTIKIEMMGQGPLTSAIA